MWKNITKVVASEDFRFNGPSSNVGFILGDGSSIHFWRDEWIEGVVLKDVFPRIFALSVNKLGKVKEFGTLSINGWQWEIPLRRRLFGWELHQWSVLMSLLKGHVVCDSFKDSFVWKGSTSGKYSVYLYCKSVRTSSNSDKEVWKLVWKGLAPSKVEVFCWQLFRGRIAVKEQLVRRGLLDTSLASCTFCKVECESIGHLFFSCYSSWKIWMYCCSLWGLHWVVHHDPSTMFMAWQHALPDKYSKELWIMSFYAITWSIWLLRNDMAFNGKVFDLEQFIDTFKIRLASWFKAKWPKSLHTISEIVNFSKDVQAPKVSKTSKRTLVWKTPPPNFLKFNVDGSARGKPGLAGIGGALRDCKTAIKAVFSKSIGVADSNLAELLAVREALKVFTSTRWASTHRLIIESDSTNVVKWMLNPSGVPWSMKRHMAHIELYKLQLLSCDCIFIPREGNVMADTLAKSGVFRIHDLTVLYD